MSTITWSLRDRPVWICLPRSPSSSVRIISTWEWMSSTPGSSRNPVVRAFSYSFPSEATSRAAPSAGMRPASESMITWAMDPITS
ncbi:MAG: hypothetical protein R2751_11015 [Bacteroidales bacterium]